MAQGYFCLVLHAHLPFVRHPEEEYFLEENWLYEAITETYIPLIKVLEGLWKDRVHVRVTMSLTPTLVSMLQDPLLQDRYLRHLDKLIELAGKEIERTGFIPHYHGLALMYHHNLLSAREVFLHRFHKDLVAAFRFFQEQGVVEILASSATHGFSPLLNVEPQAVRAQIKLGVEHYRKTFGRQPKGFWLPECGFYPGLDEVLKEAGIQYFFVDSHAIIHADPVPAYSVYAPVYCPSGVAAFGRDWESSKQVWSSKEGYPGDPDYREYYRDIGHELEFDYIKPYIHPMGIRVNTGLKYWRITGNTPYKEAYRPDWAREKAAMHAGNFLFNREKQVEHLSAHMDRKPMVVAPYDAELFGHWWYEGPQWIDLLFRKMHFDQSRVKAITPSEYLQEYPTNQLSMPSASSWGYKGYNEFWVEGTNDWIWRHLMLSSRRMIDLAKQFYQPIKANCANLEQRALQQAARELLLAQASDWPFIMKTGTMVAYAHKRFNLHITRFNRIYQALMNSSLDENWLAQVEWRDHIFADMDCARFFLPSGKKEKAGGRRSHRSPGGPARLGIEEAGGQARPRRRIKVEHARNSV